MPLRSYITSMAALCAILSSTAFVLFAGIAAACSGTGGGGGCPAPSVSTGGYDSLTSNSVTLTGSVNPQGCYTEYAFEYGRSSEGYPDEIYGSAGSGTSSVTVSTSSAIVQPSTTYHYRLSAWSEGGEVTGGSGSFTTPAACSKPTVTTEAASFVQETSATLNGSLNTNGCTTTYSFEYGPSSSTSYPSKVSETVSNRGFAFGVSKFVSGLKANTSYHFRLSATNPTGTTVGTDKYFTTPGKDPILFVHGWKGSAGTWTTMMNRFIALGWPSSWLRTFNYDSAQSNVDTADLVAQQVALLRGATGAAKIDIVTHSMGALSSRYYLKHLGGTAVVEDFVSLAGPNHGTTSGYACQLMFEVSCIEMQPGSTFLTELNAVDETPGSVRYLTVRSECDPIINPDNSVELSGAVRNDAWFPSTCLTSHSDIHEDWSIFTKVEDFVR